MGKLERHLYPLSIPKRLLRIAFPKLKLSYIEFLHVMYYIQWERQFVIRKRQPDTRTMLFYRDAYL